MPRPTAPPSQSQGAVQAVGEAPVHFSFQICRADEGSAAGLVDGCPNTVIKLQKSCLSCMAGAKIFMVCFSGCCLLLSAGSGR